MGIEQAPSLRDVTLALAHADGIGLVVLFPASDTGEAAAAWSSPLLAALALRRLLVDQAAAIGRRARVWAAEFAAAAAAAAAEERGTGSGPVREGASALQGARGGWRVRELRLS